METPTQLRKERRWKGRFIRLGLVVLAIGVGVFWVRHKVGEDESIVIAPGGRRTVRTVGGVSRMARNVESVELGAGDMRIYNRDSTVDLVLRGAEVLAGLSPKTVAKIQAEMQKPSDKDSSGLGGLIASTVKQTVANTIGIHAAYPVSSIETMRYEGGQLVIEHTNGKTTRLFGDTKVDHREQGKTFDEQEARQFIEAVMRRKRELR